jgi:uncharacterized protein (DUF2141 family)
MAPAPRHQVQQSTLRNHNPHEKGEVMLCKSVLTLTLIFGSIAAVPVNAQTPSSTPSEDMAKANLAVSISGIRNDKGQVFIQLWNTAAGFPRQSDNAYKYVAIDANKAVNGVITTNFSGLAPGIYAISILHDENRNGKMDTNAFGVPNEGWAVSNNVITHMHAPSYEQARFQLPPSGQTISIALHY